MGRHVDDHEHRRRREIEEREPPQALPGERAEVLGQPTLVPPTVIEEILIVGHPTPTGTL
jgi:hypothetical protein